MHPLPERETDRLLALRASRILDSAPAPEFDAVVELVRDTLQVPICVISLADVNRQWFKAKCGLDIDGTDRSIAFCSYALLSDEILVIEDAACDPRFKDNPLVTGEPHIRFYAGAPLLVGPGVALGTLCVIGREPRSLQPSEAMVLQRLAKVVTGLIHGHRLAQDAARLAQDAERQSRLIVEQDRDLQIRERRFQQTERIARIGGWELNLATNTHTWSDETYRICEIPLGTQIDLDRVLSVYRPHDRPRLQAVIQRAISTGAGYDEEFELLTASGTQKWVRTVGEVETRDGMVTRLFGTFHDISERHRAEALLWRAANRDSLTGLANRNRFDELLASACSAPKAAPGLLMVDADHLKEVNDTLGHDAGDELIRAVATRLRLAVDEAGTVARVGGDEFAVLLPAPVDPSTLDHTAQAIVAAMRPTLSFKNETLKPSVSIGGAICPGKGMEDLRQAADLALYHAKSTRRGGYCFFHDQLKSAITARTVAVNTVDDALTEGDVLAHYQPVVELATGRVSGLEALARVRRGHAVHSIGDFSEALHDRRTATRITACILDRIEADVLRWRAAGIRVPRIAFNVGALDFLDGSIEEMVIKACERAGLAPSQFAMEVTESVFLSRAASTVSETAARLRSRGIIVALDDFGTGHASLAHLGTFPVDVIKMDRSFVTRMGEGGAGSVIAAALIDLAHKLDIQVVAEGVEHQVQLDQLRSMGCEKGQGYLFSRPLTPADTAQYLLAQHRRDEEGVMKPETSVRSGRRLALVKS